MGIFWKWKLLNTGGGSGGGGGRRTSDGGIEIYMYGECGWQCFKFQ